MLIAALPARDQAALGLAVYAGVRMGEILAQLMPGLLMWLMPVTRPTGESIVKLADLMGSRPAVAAPLTVNVPE